MGKPEEIKGGLGIELGISDKSIHHRAKLEDGMAHTKGIHIDQQGFSVLHHDIVGVIIAVHQRVLLRNLFHQRTKFSGLILGDIRRNEIRPGKGRFLHVGHFAVLHLDGMNAFEHIDIILGRLRHILGVVANQFGYANGVQKFGHGTVTVVHTDDAVRDCGVDAQNKGFSCVFPLLFDFRKSVFCKINLEDGFIVVAIHGAVSALGHKLTALNTHSRIGLFHRNHIGKSGHIKHLVHVGHHIDNGKFRLFLSKP